MAITDRQNPNAEEKKKLFKLCPFFWQRRTTTASSSKPSFARSILPARRRLRLDPSSYLYFPYEAGKQVRSAIKLKNTSKSHTAFKNPNAEEKKKLFKLCPFFWQRRTTTASSSKPSFARSILPARRRLRLDPSSYLYFPYEAGKQVRSAIKLKNTSKSHTAFKVPCIIQVDLF
ncbi:hypothetical protein F2Q69_00043590 [Brassica cretica]|uniref:MSP domain-containing protein n=1 Tax=Brassica cretica TaxID=69181 RepID=A0A8S9NJJ5_BRACR|nr:hypothetical protein F2Q69_00043590 [Brassica cretica]